jgi:hypothetical protein
MGGDFDRECLACAQIIDQRALPHHFIVEDVRTVMCVSVCECECVCVCVCVCVCFYVRSHRIWSWMYAPFANTDARSGSESTFQGLDLREAVLDAARLYVYTCMYIHIYIYTYI